LNEPTPNPSSGKTTLRFTVAEGSQPTFVSIEILNSVGQKISNLTQRTLEAGFYSLEWEHPEQVSPGLYFCKLQTVTGETQIKKLLIH
jgi:hypothetical protein